MEKITVSTINLNDSRIDRYMHAPLKYHGVQLSDLKSIDKEITQARASLKKNKSVTFFGGCGSGKTYSSVCLAREWAKEHMEIITVPGTDEVVQINNVPYFIQPTRFLSKIKSSWASDGLTEDEVMETYQNKGLLILDDLGVGNWTDWASGKIYDLIDYRDVNELPVIVTTNLSMSELAKVIDVRIVSRLHGMGEVLTLGDKDWRVK